MKHSVSKHRFLESLQTLVDMAKQGGTIKIKEIFTLFAGKGAAALLIILSLPFCLPIQIPGFSTPFGILLAFMGVRIAFGHHLWWPKWILEKPLQAELVEKLAEKTIKAVVFMQKMFHPRLSFLVNTPWIHRLHGLLTALLALFLALPLPLPMTNLLSAFPIFFIGIGLLEDDGVAILIGYFLAFVALSAFTFLFYLGKEHLVAIFA